MANTEGMPDEVVESLMTLPHQQPRNPRDSAASSSRRRQAIEERMEMSMGERPAARVIRASPNNHRKSKTATTRRTDVQDEGQENLELPSPPPIIGSIFERNFKQQPQADPTSSEKPPKRQSHFSQQRQQMMQKSNGKVPPLSGFPSVNMPLGTFVRTKKTGRNLPNKFQANAASESSVVDLNLNRSGKINSQDTSAPVSFASLQKASAQDADAMLAQMSSSERIEKAQEIQAALSPETIAFLKQRAAARNKPLPGAREEVDYSDQASRSSRSRPGHSIAQNKKTGYVDFPELGGTVEEKQRMADVLSKIKTYDDLDEAYQAEMGNYSPLQSTEISSEIAKLAEDDDPFQLACALLRSTVPRQNLWAAQVVASRLRDDWTHGKLSSLVPGSSSALSPWPYPLMLPASLRCLLDFSLSHTNGYVLHTYALQALYDLLRLRACQEHIVVVDDLLQSKRLCDNVNIYASAIYQECFYEDAVPTPPLDNCYESTAKVESVSTTSGDSDSSTSATFAYKTSSSSASAKKDGEAFVKDPLWTLVSRMCIIPRFAQLLRLATQSKMIPKEAIISICGVLAMTSQRSPGAATAIVHHQTLLKDLLDVTVMPQEIYKSEASMQPRDQPYDPVVAVPAIRVLCVLARQSRVTASLIPFDEIVPPIMALKPKTTLDYELQRYSVVLWRSLLRYGFGLPQIPIMITMATPHMALAPGTDLFSLVPEFSSSFANILQCLQVSRRYSQQQKFHNDVVLISSEQLNALSQCEQSLSASAQQVMRHLEKLESTLESQPPPKVMRVFAGQLQFISAFVRITGDQARLSLHKDNGESKFADASVAETWIGSCQQVVTGLAKSKLFKHALQLVAPGAFSLSCSSPAGNDAVKIDDLAQEAAACAFLCSFFSLQQWILQETRLVDESINFVAKTVAEEIASAIERIGQQVAEKHDGTKLPLARQGWLNRVCFSVVDCLVALKNLETIPSSFPAQLLRQLQMMLLGRLERGDEAMAVMVFSDGSSFEATGSPETNNQENSSALSSMFFGELCRSNTARLQLDHSFKLRHGPGITPEEAGPFKLSSLLSTVDLPGQHSNSDFVLPAGQLWLWQVLSSSISGQTNKSMALDENGHQKEGAQILASCLHLILELENETDSTFAYSSLIPTGAKLYHLMNICVHPERILQDNIIISPAELILEKYCSDMGPTFCVDFAKACLIHSGSGIRKSNSQKNEGSSSEADEKLLNQLLDPPNAVDLESLSEKELRSLVTFSRDLCEMYVEYGAQYDFFTRCVRIFLLPAFPPKVRSQTMRRLGEILHLINLPTEDDPLSENCQVKLAEMLERSVSGGLYQQDGSCRESSDFLDAMAALFAKGGNPRLVFGYVLLLGILVHSRHLANCLQPDFVGLDAAKKRLQSMNIEFASIILDATKRFLASQEKNKKQLVAATMIAAQDWEKARREPGFQQTTLNIWDVVEGLKELTNAT